jgi:hypothetical protein
MSTPANFTELFWRTIQAWGYHGYLLKSKTSTAQNQTQLQGDKIWNYHAQLSQVLHSFRTSEYVFQDMQEGNMLCGRYGPHMPQIQQMVFKQCGP